MRIILNPNKITSGQIKVDFGAGFETFQVADVRENGIQIPSYVKDLSVIKIKTGSNVITNIDVLYNATTFSDWNHAQESKEVTLNENSTFVIEPDEGSDVVKKVIAHVDVPQTTVSANLEVKDVNITENGAQTVVASEGYDGLSQVNVNVNVPDRELNLETKELFFDSNGTYYVDKSDESDGIQQVKIDINVPNPAVVENQTLDVTENGTYTLKPAEGFEGIGEATVNVNVNTEVHNLEDKFVSFTENGVFPIEHTEVEEGETPYNGFDNVLVSVDVQPKIAEVEPITYTRNGEYTVEVPEGFDGQGNISVNVNVPNPAVVQEKELSINSNGTYTLEPDEEYEGLSKATFNVDIVPTVDITYPVSENGEYEIEIPETKLRDKEEGEETAPVGKVKVNVSVPAPEMILSDEVVNIDANTGDEPIVVTPSGDANGIGSVTINVNVPNPHEVEEKEVTVTENDTDVILEPSEGLEGISKATVHVAIPMDEGEDVIFIDPAHLADNDRISVENGVISILPQEGKAGLKKVKIVLTSSLTDPIYIEPEAED